MNFLYKYTFVNITQPHTGYTFRKIKFVQIRKPKDTDKDKDNSARINIHNYQPNIKNN